MMSKTGARSHGLNVLPVAGRADEVQNKDQAYVTEISNIALQVDLHCATT